MWFLKSSCTCDVVAMNRVANGDAHVDSHRLMAHNITKLTITQLVNTMAQTTVTGCEASSKRDEGLRTGRDKLHNRRRASTHSPCFCHLAAGGFI